MYLSHANILKLRSKIERAFDKPILTQRDCMQLSQAIMAQTGHSIGHHTLRRFFGLVEWSGDFRTSTLNHLAEYLGHSNVKYILDTFKDEEDLIEILVKLQREKIDIDEYYIGKSMRTAVTIESAMMAGHMMLIRLEQGDQERVIRMLNTQAELDRYREDHYAIASVLAHYVGESFHALTEKLFVKRLMQETPYINLILSFYVPLTEMDGSYGQHIRWMLEFSSNPIHQGFGNSLLATNALLKGDSKGAREFLDLVPKKQHYFSILRGRLDVLKYLTATDPKPIDRYIHPTQHQEIFYFTAILPLLVLMDKKDDVDALMQKHNIENLTANHWLEEAVKRQTYLVRVWSEAKDGLFDEAPAALKLFRSTTWPKDYEGISQLIAQRIEDLLPTTKKRR